MHFPIANMDKRGNVAAQVERVQLDSGFGGAKRGPRKKRQAQIDGGGVQGVDRLLEIDTERVVGVERPRHGNQTLREIGIDAPVAHGIGVSQGVARHRGTNSEVVELGLLCAQTGLDVPQTLSLGQLREVHAQELIQTRE